MTRVRAGDPPGPDYTPCTLVGPWQGATSRIEDDYDHDHTQCRTEADSY